MKKLIIAAAFFLMSLCFAERLSAGNFGVLGGAGFYTGNLENVGSRTLTRWHAGLTYKFNLPAGFQIQPALVYDVKAAVADAESRELSVGYLELLASVQWGVDLILFRPFVEVSPFVGYGLNGWGDFKKDWQKAVNGLDYGVGLGGGLQVWRFQLAARYNWSFGRIRPLDETGFRNADFSGVTLSLAYFF